MFLHTYICVVFAGTTSYMVFVTTWNYRYTALYSNRTQLVIFGKYKDVIWRIRSVLTEHVNSIIRRWLTLVTQAILDAELWCHLLTISHPLLLSATEKFQTSTVFGTTLSFRQLQSQLPIGADLNRKQDALRECKIPDTAIVSSMHHLWSHSWVLLNTRTWPARRKFDQDEDLMDFVHLSRDLCGWTNFQRRWRRRWLVSSRMASRRCWGQENR